MNKTIISFLALLFISLGCASVSEKSWSDGQQDTFLWHVADSDSEIFLLGSIHIGDKGMYPLDSEINAAFEESEGLVVELDPENVNQMEAMHMMVYDDGTKLSDKLSPEMYEKVKQSVGAMIPADMLEKFKPWAAGLMMMQLDMAKSGFTGDYGIDRHFLDKAKKKGLVIEELETLKYQLSLFDNMNDMGDDLIDYFTQEGAMTGTEILSQMFTEWKKGDIDGLEKIMEDQMAESGNEAQTKVIREKFFTQRNIEMTTKVKNYLSGNKKYFVVAGAGHMIGEGGIIDLLTKSGEDYIITRY